MSLFFKFRNNRGAGGGGAGAAPCAVQVMDGGVAAPRRAPVPVPDGDGAAPRRAPPPDRSPARAGLHVNFSDKGEVKERREKFLTAKYGSHQMALIRKRLAVEMWLYDELQKLYDVPKEAAGAGGRGGGGGGGPPAQEVEVDVDELLDMDSDDLRRAHLATLLADAKKPQKDVHKFINELLDKAKTL